jgi:long-chain acyl-CoA synthetase
LKQDASWKETCLSASETTLLQQFWRQVDSLSSKPALVSKVSGQWVALSWKEYGEQVSRFASALQKQNLKPGDRFILFSDNCPEWIIADLGAQMAGLITVPIYPNESAENARYIAEHSESVAGFVRGKDRLEKFKSHPLRIIPFDECMKIGSPDTAPYREFSDRMKGSDVATIVYTSGTTGFPKGVMLSHQNLIVQGKCLVDHFSFVPQGISFSFLPLSHIAARLLHGAIHLVSGTTTYFAQSMETVAQDLRDVRPTDFFGVPRIWEKFQEAIESKVNMAPERRRKIFEWTLKNGREYEENQLNGKPNSGLLKLRTAIGRLLVGRKIRRQMGLDRCRLFISGAAPLDSRTAYFFAALGMPITEGYGQTECSGVSHGNRPGRSRIGTVGEAIRHTQCKIAEDGEILVRGEHVFLGYFKNENLTRETLIDGWLHTGDVGEIDSQGFLKITDRKKDIIVTSGGKNITPSNLELLLKRHPWVSQAVIVGDRRKYLTALITLKDGRLKDEAESAIQRHVDEMNLTLPSYSTIKKFSILDRDFSQEGGEITPTMKVKRSFVQEKYKSVIDALYL